jgi:hypothetical protein
MDRRAKLKSVYTKPELRERLKRKIMAGGRGGRPGQWSARKAQMLSQEYKSEGGGYKGGRTEGQRSLSRWTKQDWTTPSGKPSVQGPNATGEVYAPRRAIQKLTSTAKGRAKLAQASRKKREASKSGEQYVSHGLHAGKSR